MMETRTLADAISRNFPSSFGDQCYALFVHLFAFVKLTAYLGHCISSLLARSLAGLAEMVNVALNSSKTGIRVPAGQDLLRYLILHYMGLGLGVAAIFEFKFAHAYPSDTPTSAKSKLPNSRSALDKLHSRVAEPLGEALEEKVCIMCDFSLL
ncbi:hypothetical protein EON65_37890 [archaeon]|nr:MAG: hypothetical protein EON65_37890 [archaeon]